MQVRAREAWSRVGRQPLEPGGGDQRPAGGWMWGAGRRQGSRVTPPAPDMGELVGAAGWGSLEPGGGCVQSEGPVGHPRGGLGSSSRLLPSLLPQSLGRCHPSARDALPLCPRSDVTSPERSFWKALSNVLSITAARAFPAELVPQPVMTPPGCPPDQTVSSEGSHWVGLIP